MINMVKKKQIYKILEEEKSKMIKKMKYKNTWRVKLFQMAVDTENGKIKK